MTLVTGGEAQGGGEMTFAETDTAAEHDVGVVVDTELIQVGVATTAG